jgi:hypothetical protein
MKSLGWKILRVRRIVSEKNAWFWQFATLTRIFNENFESSQVSKQLSFCHFAIFMRLPPIYDFCETLVNLLLLCTFYQFVTCMYYLLFDLAFAFSPDLAKFAALTRILSFRLFHMQFSVLLIAILFAYIANSSSCFRHYAISPTLNGIFVNLVNSLQILPFCC